MPILEKMDLRKALFQLYLKNNPKLEHQIFIYRSRKKTKMAKQRFKLTIWCCMATKRAR